MDGARETRQRRKPRVLFSQVHNSNLIPPIWLISDFIPKKYEITKNIFLISISILSHQKNFFENFEFSYFLGINSEISHI